MEPAAHMRAHASSFRSTPGQIARIRKKARVPGLSNTRGSFWLPLTLQHCKGASEGLFLFEQPAKAASLAFSSCTLAAPGGAATLD